MAKNMHKGFATLYLVLLTLFFMAAITASSFLLISWQQRTWRNTQNSVQAYWAAESGLEDAVYRIITNKQYLAGYALAIGDSTVDVTVSGNDTKTIIAEAQLRNVFRNTQAVLVSNTTTPQFHYGVQVGQGGVIMGQNSKIEGAEGTAGNVYSNGAVIGDNGATVTGDVTVAGINSIDNVVVYGTARVNSITNSKICGDAYYRIASSIDASSKSFLDSPKNPTCGGNPLTPGAGYPNQPDPPISPMSISQANIDQWKNDAVEGGTITGNCGDSNQGGGSNPSCTILDKGTISVGPKKITGNLVLTKKQTLTITGTLYLQGNIDIDSSSGATIKCDPSFFGNSCIVVTDSWMHIENNAMFQGSGAAGSYVMLLTTLAGCNGGSQQPQCTHHNGAIDIHNNATGVIFYAVNSLVNLHNGVHVSEIVASTLQLSNNTVVTYEQGLLNVQFSSGPGISWEVVSWKEVE